MIIKRAAKQLFHWFKLFLYGFIAGEVTAALLDWNKAGTKADFSKILLDSVPSALCVAIGVIVGSSFISFALRVAQRNGGWSVLRRRMTCWLRRSPHSC
jgi:hypothetical protein